MRLTKASPFVVLIANSKASCTPRGITLNLIIALLVVVIRPNPGVEIRPKTLACIHFVHKAFKEKEKKDQASRGHSSRRLRHKLLIRHPRCHHLHLRDFLIPLHHLLLYYRNLRLTSQALKSRNDSAPDHKQRRCQCLLILLRHLKTRCRDKIYSLLTSI